MICAWTPSNGVRSRRCIVCQVDVVQPPVLVAAGVLQVQQVPPVVRPGEHPDAAVGVVGDHAGRCPVRAVRPTGAIHTLSTPSCGAIQASWLPSGLMRGLMRSRFPKRTRRG